MPDKKEIPPGRLCPSCNHDKRFFAVQKKICTGYPWYEPQDIRYCTNQILFLIEHLNLLLEGRYPADPYVSGYVGGGFAGVPDSAPYEMAETLAGESEVRLWNDGRTNESGQFLLAEIWKYHVTRYKDLTEPSQRVVRYLSGRWRKVQNYSDWKAHEGDKSIPYHKGNAGIS